MIGAPLHFFNSLGRRTEPFVPPTSRPVGLYSCGPTVYSYPHLGNLRPYVFSDTLRRVLTWKGQDVDQVINITDVGHTLGDDDLAEDKVERAARHELRSVADLTAHYTQAFFDDLDDLGVLAATEYPRASRYVPQMIEFAKELDRKGFTYQLPSGLYFDTTKSAGYGELAGLSRDGHDRARIDLATGKRSAADFAIWRADAPGERRVLRWDSPWGPGVPGWHLECAVMSMALLGRHFDIHTGGVDHREIHHVNEIAQSEAYLGKPAPGEPARWVPLWMHNEFLLLGNMKMSKSAGTMPVLTDLVKAGFHPLTYRYFLLTAHYRSQLDFTDAGLASAAAAFRRLLVRVAAVRPLPTVPSLAAARELLEPAGQAALDRIDAALSDDLNTPRVLAELQAVLRADELPDSDRAVVIAATDQVLGLRLADLDPGDAYQRSGALTVPGEYVDKLVADRQRARQDRDWAAADRIRGDLRALGVEITDTPTGPRWSAVGSE